MATTKIAQRNTDKIDKSTDKSHNRVEETTRAEEEEQRRSRRTATINLPLVTAEFRAPDIHMPTLPVRAPNRSDLTAVTSKVRWLIPSPQQVVYYAGLGVLGVLEIIEWPVALAIAAGTAIATRPGRSPQPEEGKPEAEKPEAGKPDGSTEESTGK